MSAAGTANSVKRNFWSGAGKPAEFSGMNIGPAPVLIPAAIWVFYNDHIGWGIFLVVVAVVSMSLDNVLRPILIRMGADLPLLLIFAGVIGGLLSFGLVGIFVGPVVLAVAYTLLQAWISDGEKSGEKSEIRPAP